MRRWSLLGALVAALVLTAACGDDGDDGDQRADRADGDVAYEGDPDSAFCQASRAAADQPVLDPFAAGLEPVEVEERFQALAQRFARFAQLAPEALAGDLALLDESFGELTELLEEADYDFERLATTDVDISLFDDPAFAAVAERLAAYQTQVCEG